MKATETAEHSDVIRCEGESPYYKLFGQWYYRGIEADISLFEKTDYIPLVPKKIYKVGDQVTFLEALNSGMCFKAEGHRFVFKWKDEELLVFSGLWEPNEWPISDFRKKACTLCEDPSVSPKPTLESLPAWTRCKVEPVNNDSTWWDVIKKPNGSFMHHYSGNDFEWVNVKLISIYNPKTEQWEDV